MRIVSGQFGGRQLEVPRNRNIRPTSDKLRGAIFNMLVSRGAVEGAIVLDAFCGTGALGLEAISRGAAHCRFVDRVRESMELAQTNAKNLGVLDVAAFVVKDARKMKANGHKFTLVFLDPPYGQDLVADMLDALVEVDCLEKHAWIVCETEKGAALEHEDYEIDNEKTYGDTTITLLKFKQQPRRKAKRE